MTPNRAGRTTTIPPLHLALFVLRATFYALGPIGFMVLLRDGMNPFVGVSYFLIIGGALMFLVDYVYQGDVGKRSGSELKYQEVSRSMQYVWLGLLVVITPLIYLSFIYAMSLGSIVETSILARLAPLIFLLLGLWLLKEQILSVTRVLCAYMLMIGGAVYMVLGSFAAMSTTLMFAWLFGLAVALTQASESVLMILLDRHTKRTKAFIIAFVTLVSGVLLFVILLLFFPSMLTIPSLVELGILAFLGLCTIGVPHLIGIVQTDKLRRPSFVATNAYLVVLITAPLAFLVHGEVVDWPTLFVASTLIAVGMWLQATGVRGN